MINPLPHVLALACAAASLAPLAAQTPLAVWDARVAYVPQNDGGLAVLADSDGGAWVAVDTSTGGFDPHVLARFDAAGQELWRTSFGASDFNLPYLALCDDGAGGVFVAGQIRGTGFADPPLGPLEDGFLARFDGAGNLLWARRLGSSGAATGARALLADGAGGAVVLGRTSGGSLGGPPLGVEDSFIARHDAAGNALFTERLGAAQTSTLYSALTANALGGYDCAGARFDWNAFITSAAVARLDALGQLAWVQDALETDTLLAGMAGGPAGEIVAAGTNTASNQGRILRLDAAGGLLSSDAFPAFPSTLSEAAAVARLPDGTYLAGGTAEPSSPVGPALRVLRRFDDQGALLWEEALAAPTGTPDTIAALDPDGRGSAFLTGAHAEPPGPMGFTTTTTWLARVAVDLLGVPGCAGRPNSTGASATTYAVGSDVRVENAVTVFAQGMPPGEVGYFIASPTSDFVPNPGGSPGNLCLGGAIGRANRPGEVQNSGQAGRFHLLLDLDDVPTPASTTSVLAGQPWYFQAWYRDTGQGGVGNFTGSVEVTTQ